MRFWFLLLAALALLGACDLVPVGVGAKPKAVAAPADPLAPTYVTTEDDPALEGDTAAAPADPEEIATGPGPEVAAVPAVAEPPEPPDANAEVRALCTRNNGNFTRTQAGAFVCVSRTRDAGKSCTASSQCQGSCLARSGTCAPVKPLIGCHEIATVEGAVATVCIE